MTEATCWLVFTTKQTAFKFAGKSMLCLLSKYENSTLGWNAVATLKLY